MSEPQKMRQLFPAIAPHDTGRLKVSARHELYYEQYGSPGGKPVVILHGGPGGGIIPILSRFHDPAHYRMVLFDQRGCGRSTPHAELSENTTWDLVADMERLRQHLGIERWQVFGGSWGSTLALAYAESYPERVRELIVRGIFLLREKEIRWFYQEGASALFPEAWAEYLAPIPEAERHDLVAAYHRRLTGPDRTEQIRAAKVWSVWEANTSSLLPDAARSLSFLDDHFALAFARIECHYFFNKGFFHEDGQLLANAHRLAGIPGAIVQGRYDVVCPPMSAHDLHLAWPQASYDIIANAGHASSEPGIADALLRATGRFAGQS